MNPTDWAMTSGSDTQALVALLGTGHPFLLA
jgi:hypothetical protein